MECEYIEIYYIHPAIMTYVPVTKNDIEKRCLSKIIIGDNQKIERLNKILMKAKEERKVSKGIVDSVTFKIKMKFPNREEIWIVDKSRNFEFNDKDKGKIPTRFFKELTSIFDSGVKVVDLKYWEKIQKN